MSKLNRIYFAAFFFFACLLFFPLNILAETIEATVKITTRAPSTIEVRGRNISADVRQKERNFSFLQNYAGIENLAERISQVALFDERASKIDYRKLSSGEYLAESNFSEWSYQINAAAPKNESAKAHVSFIDGEQGILMLGDLLPINVVENNNRETLKITFELPSDWKIVSNEKKISERVFEIADVEKAVFYIGKNWREKEIDISGDQVKFLIFGERQFSDAEAFAMAEEIYAFYKNLFGAEPNQKALIYLSKFSSAQSHGRWEAETRGSNVTIFSAEMPFKTQSLQRLHEQLRHEIFHLWMPSRLSLSGNYDWFYEGFALYQSLRVGVTVNRLRFEDFLDTLARARTIDNLQSRKISLIEASKNRWNGANTQIYARGMLVAFLCDALILQKSKGKNSLSDVFREIYQKHKLPAPRQDGNTAILQILESREELRPITENYVKNARAIDWRTTLETIGIESVEENFQTKLKAKEKPNGRQKDLLDRLGYNNWRKLRKVQNENQ